MTVAKFDLEGIDVEVIEVGVIGQPVGQRLQVEQAMGRLNRAPVLVRDELQGMDVTAVVAFFLLELLAGRTLDVTGGDEPIDDFSHRQTSIIGTLDGTVGRTISRRGGFGRFLVQAHRKEILSGPGR